MITLYLRKHDLVVRKCCSNKLLFIFTLNWFQYFNINPAKNKSKIHTDKIAWLSTLRLLHKQATYLGLLHVGSYVWYVTVIMSDNRSFFLSFALPTIVFIWKSSFHFLFSIRYSYYFTHEVYEVGSDQK